MVGCWIVKLPSIDFFDHLRLIVSTVLVAICAEFLVDSIDGMVEGSGISLPFVGLILLPIVGNAAEVSLARQHTLILARHGRHCGQEGQDGLSYRCSRRFINANRPSSHTV